MTALSNYGINRDGTAFFEFEDGENILQFSEGDEELLYIEPKLEKGCVTFQYTREQVAKMIPFLQNFVKDGTILGDKGEGENRKLALLLYKTKLPVMDETGEKIIDYFGGEDTTTTKEAKRKKSKK